MLDELSLHYSNVLKRMTPLEILVCCRTLRMAFLSVCLSVSLSICMLAGIHIACGISYIDITHIDKLLREIPYVVVDTPHAVCCADSTREVSDTQLRDLLRTSKPRIFQPLSPSFSLRPTDDVTTSLMEAGR